MLQERSQNAEPKKPHWTQTPKGKEKLKNMPRYDEKFKKKVVAYMKNGHTSLEAQKKFGAHASSASYWYRSAGFSVRGRKLPPEPRPEPRATQNTHLLARKLKQAVRERLMAGMELEEVEIYASLLVKEILK